jgi:hypothetical protein
MSIQQYASYFKEKYWEDFAEYHKGAAERLSPHLITQLDDTCIPNDIKMVIISMVRDFASEWVRKGLPLLDDKTPIELVASEEGIKALKAGLMRMPA